MRKIVNFSRMPYLKSINSSKYILLFVYRRNEIFYRENASPRERP